MNLKAVFRKAMETRNVNLNIKRNNVNKRRIRAHKTQEWERKRERIRNEVTKEDSLKSVSKTS